MSNITIIQPDDWHLHLRDGEVLRATVAASARCFARAIVMPNLDPPVTTTEQALAYRQRIIDASPAHSTFEPLMTLYLHDDMPLAEIDKAKASAYVHAMKLYPAGATTNSARGVSTLEAVYPLLEKLERVDLPLLIHGEVVDAAVDVFDRECAFIERDLQPLVERFPSLRVVFEHITTADAVEFVRAQSATLAATITAHHLCLNRNALFQGGLRPHHYCLPVLKRERHRKALVTAAISGEQKFFLGTDSAPHSRQSKESGCGCAGLFTAHAAIEVYAEVFEAAGALDKLERFASLNGAAFYGLAANARSLTLTKRATRIPETLDFSAYELVPFRAGESVGWSILP